MFRVNDTIVFQGDSITDALRSRETKGPNLAYGLGGGFCGLVGSALLVAWPEKSLRIYNRGTSGDKVEDLLERWETETIGLQPTWINILAGVNNAVKNPALNEDAFQHVYASLLELSARRLPGVRIVVCEPFAVSCGGMDAQTIERVRHCAAITRNLAESFGVMFVPFQQLFGQLEKKAAPAYWIPDGIHPSAAGHFAMAAFWMRHVLAEPLPAKSPLDQLISL
jgi:lysophospholipase L1-like esterase